MYAVWKTSGEAESKINDKGGCGTTVPVKVPIGDGTYVYFKACVDKSWPTNDLCSGWAKQKL